MAAQLDPTRPDLLVAQRAARQHGIVSRRQLIAAGLSRHAIDHRVASGLLHRVHRGVYAVGHPPLTREAWWMAAVLACGDGAALSHASAAALWELRPSAAVWIDVTVATRAGRATRDGIRVHRSGTLAAADITEHRGIPVTSVARTLLDIAGVLPAAALARALERTEVLRRFDLRSTRAVIDAHPASRGAKRLTAALELYRDDEMTRSDLEAFFRTLCADHDVPRPLVNAVIEGEEVDFLWRRERLVVETDGRETHLTRAAFERDRAKDAKLTLAGYRVVRFTYRQVEHQRDATGATLLALLSSSR
jgi:hypothetical protein